MLIFQINYKASLLHLQPRQMRLEITDLRDEGQDEKTATTDSLNKGMKLCICIVSF